MARLTQKEKIIIERILRPLVDSDLFDEADHRPEGMTKEQADKLLESAYLKINKDVENG